MSSTNSLYLTHPRGKSFPREGQSTVPPRGLTISVLVHFLASHLMFHQIIRSTQLDTPCLQQSRTKKNALRLFVFRKEGYKARAQTFSRGQHCWVTLRRSQNNRNVGTCCAKSLINFTLYATSANIVVVPCKRTQQVTTLLGPTMLRPFAWGFKSGSCMLVFIYRPWKDGKLSEL